MKLEGTPIHCYCHKRPLDHIDRADIWNDYKELLDEILSDMEDCNDHAFTHNINGVYVDDEDADNFRAFFDLIEQARNAVEKHCFVLNTKAFKQEHPREYWTQTVHAWALGLKPAILRDEGIDEFRRVEFPEWHNVSNWEEISAFRPNQDFSEENTRIAIKLWRVADPPAKDRMRDAWQEFKRVQARKAG